MKKPKVSILMPVYNERDFIVKAVESVMDQTERDWELIIIDDGSTDNCVSLVEDHFLDERIKILKPGKVGKNGAFNDGYKESNGDWILFLAGDDILPKDSLEKRLAAMQDYDPMEQRIGGFGQLKMISIFKKYEGVVVPKSQTKGTKSGGTLIISRRLASKTFPIPEQLTNEDMWTVLCIENFAEKEVHIPSIVLYYRIHSKNSYSRLVSFSEKNESMHRRSLVYGVFLEKFREELTLKERKRLISLEMAEDYRYSRRSTRILLLCNLSIFEKFKYFGHSKPLLYKIRMNLFDFFSGWNRGC